MFFTVDFLENDHWWLWNIVNLLTLRACLVMAQLLEDSLFCEEFIQQCPAAVEVLNLVAQECSAGKYLSLSFLPCFIELCQHVYHVIMDVNYFQKFFCIYWDTIWMLYFNLLLWSIILIKLMILSHSCIPLIYCWNIFANVFLRIFASMLVSTFACNFIFWFTCMLSVLD